MKKFYNLTLQSCVFLLLSSGNSFAQVFTKEIVNYSIEDYSADNQNWGIDVSDDGIVYIANNKGLLRYTGNSWQLFELPNKTIIRSVLVVGDTIYTGSYEEFGFWKNDDFGNLSYTSLSRFFEKGYEIYNEEFWQIVKYGDNIIFRSFANVYSYDGKKISTIPDSHGGLSISIYRDKLIVCSLNRGMEELDGGLLKPFKFKRGNLKSKNISNAASHKNKIFFYDIEKGGFVYDSEKITGLEPEINRLLKEQILNKAVFLDSNLIAFGTIKNGILIYNLKSQKIQYAFNRKLGLQNNTVLRLKYHEGKLWCALDNGASRIGIDSPYLNYKDHSGTLGTVYDVAFYKDKYYLASNTGLYLFKDDKLSFVKGSEGHIWSLSTLDNQLFCGHNSGIFYLDANNQLKLLNKTSGGVFGYFSNPKRENSFLLGTYNGISFLKKENEKWVSKAIKNIDFPVNKIVFESKFVIWATHPYKGVYRITLKDDYTEALEIAQHGNNKSFSSYITKIYSINDTITFYNSEKWFHYFPESASIGVHENFQKYNGKRLLKPELMGNWFVDDNFNTIAYHNDSGVKTLEIEAAEIKKRSVSKYEKIIQTKDSLRIINLNDGFSIFNINLLKNKIHLPEKPTLINKIYSNRKHFSIKDSLLQIPFRDAQYISFEIYTPFGYESSHTYELSGEIDQKESIENGKLTLQNLKPGNYTLSIDNESLETKPKKVNSFRFKVLPPWYWTTAMKVVYFTAILSVIFIIYKINKTRIRRQQLNLQRQHIRETQKRINEIEKNNLEKEIRSKKKELVNSVDSIIRKNETIMVLLHEIERLEKFSPNPSRTKKVLKSSKKSIRSINNWKAFESNFNELHQDFFKKLIEIHPKLTVKDLRLCSYIKTGLKSKEIAPLLGISPRGVEIHRYRLRKKLNLPPNTNLSNFFNFLIPENH